MYLGGSVIGKASKIDPEISPICPHNFHRGQKVQNLASFLTSLNFEPPAFENAARYLNSVANFFYTNGCPMPLPSLVKLGPRTPKNYSIKAPHP